MTYAKGFYEAQKGADMTFSDKAREVLEDADKPLGNGPEQFEALLAALTAAHQEALIEELEGALQQHDTEVELSQAMYQDMLKRRIAELKGQKDE